MGSPANDRSIVICRARASTWSCGSIVACCASIAAIGELAVGGHGVDAVPQDAVLGVQVGPAAGGVRDLPQRADVVVVGVGDGDGVGVGVGVGAGVGPGAPGGFVPVFVGELLDDPQEAMASARVSVHTIAKTERYLCEDIGASIRER